MGLDLNWYPGEEIETIWKGDKALGPVPEDVLAEWEKDGAAEKLRPYVLPGQEPLVFHYRSLNLKEKNYCYSQYVLGDAVAAAEAFKIGVRFPFPADPVKMDDGTKRERYVHISGGIRMMADQLALGIERANPGIVLFYGMRIIGGVFMSEAEKKALLPPSTERRSKAEASTPDGTAETGKQEPPPQAA